MLKINFEIVSKYLFNLIFTDGLSHTYSCHRIEKYIMLYIFISQTLSLEIIFIFLSLKIVFVSENSADTDKMLCSMAFHLGLQS